MHTLHFICGIALILLLSLLNNEREVLKFKMIDAKGHGQSCTRPH